MLNIPNVVNQFIDIHYKEEWWIENKLSENDAQMYFLRMLAFGNIILYTQADSVAGFVEFWRISPEQFGRHSLGLPIYNTEDLMRGDVCYINSFFVAKEHRFGECIEYLKTELFNRNKDAKFFVYERQKNKSIRIYNPKEIQRFLGEHYGKE